MQLTKNINTPNFVRFYQQRKFYLFLTTTYSDILLPNGASEIFAVRLSGFTSAILAIFVFYQYTFCCNLVRVARTTETCIWILINARPYFISVHLFVYCTCVNILTFHKILFPYQVTESCVKLAQFYHTTKGVTLQNAANFKRSLTKVTTFVVLTPCNHTTRRHTQNITSKFEVL